MSGIPRRAIEDGAITPKKLASSNVDGSYFYERMNYQPVCTDAASWGSAPPTGADDSYFNVHFRNGIVNGHYIGAATILGPSQYPASPGDATQGVGLDLALDKAVGEGSEYVWDVDGVGGFGEFAYVVGSGPATQIKGTFVLSDVSGVSEFAVGFRKTEAGVAAIDDYTDMAVINVQAGTINVETILNDGATATTDTGLTWADTEEHELKVVLGIADNGAANGAGVARFFVDGVEVGAPFTFDTGDTLIPFIHQIQTADATEVIAMEIEVSQLTDVDDYFVH
jgi:hypothetical protein